MSSKPDTARANNALLTPDEAITKYETAVKTDASAANYLELGAAYYIARRWDDALQAFQKTVEIDPRQGYGYYYLGILYAAMGQREQADRALAQVLTSTTNEMLKEQAQTRIPAIQSFVDLGGNQPGVVTKE